MTAIVGLSMILAGILIIRAAKIGVRLAPPPWWASDVLSTNVLAPAFAGLCGAGAAAIASWLHAGQWRAASAGTAGSVAVAAAVFAVLWRAMSVWQERVRPSAPVIPLGPTRDSRQQAPLRRAA